MREEEIKIGAIDYSYCQCYHKHDMVHAILLIN